MDIRTEHFKGNSVSIRAKIHKINHVRAVIEESIWQCPDCGMMTHILTMLEKLRKPLRCNMCGNKKDLKYIDKKMTDVRDIQIKDNDKPHVILDVLLIGEPAITFVDKIYPNTEIVVIGKLEVIPEGTKYKYLLKSNDIKFLT